ncbi:MAG: hypothetical protein H5U10_05760 [Desulfacinum sp.]|nr:hypothetical protein [Desulfacinum sp.]
MSRPLKWTLFVLMSSALAFGFLDRWWPGGPTPLPFERLHIFLFNLCAGGTILIHHTEGTGSMTLRARAFLGLSLTYALAAFCSWYEVCVVTAWALSALVETLRRRVFGAFPWEFFDLRVRVARKFHQASLLCLAIGLFLSGVVILNNHFFHWVSWPRLELRSFFLGFSFPLSLITMSVMFRLIREQLTPTVRVLKNVAFWTVNLGVILFFAFIIFDRFGLQLVVSSVLTLCVLLIFALYARLGLPEQQKNFLTSGICFLLFTAVTGIAYIALHYAGRYSPQTGAFLLRLHALVSLYGWNLSGLAVLCRYDDFPIRLHSRKLIAAHWLTVAVLAPLGTTAMPAAPLAWIGFTVVVHAILFSRPGPGRYDEAKAA